MGNGVQGTFSYNDHLQLSKIRYFKSGSPDVLNLGYDYTSAVQPSNNGQLQAVHYYTQDQPAVEDRTKSESFTYDSWLRLKSAQTLDVNTTSGSKTWSLAWTYDRLGNRKTQSLITGDPSLSIGQPSFTIDETKNRINGFTYDNAGNMTADTAFTYAYDAANRMKQTQQIASPNTTVTSTYFGPLRIKKVVGPPNGPATSTVIYIYSGSTPIAEYLNGSLSKEYIYADSKLVATVAGAATTYHHSDHLSNRAETDGTGAVVRSFGHFPFGEVWYESSSDPGKFTSYTRDSGTGESGLDYAMFRQYNPMQARFMSVDLMSGYRAAPQSLNRYAYTQDPINGADHLGLFGKPLCWIEYVGELAMERCLYDPSLDRDDDIGYTDGGGTDVARKKLCPIRVAIGQAKGRPNDPTFLLPGEAELVKSIYADAGIDLEFVQTNPDFIVGITDIPPIVLPGGLEQTRLGYAPPGTNLALVDRGKIETGLAGSGTKLDPGIVEGRVMAHEIGHDLGLQHSKAGIMRDGTEQGKELYQIDFGSYRFTPEQKKALLKACEALPGNKKK